MSLRNVKRLQKAANKDQPTDSEPVPDEVQEEQKPKIKKLKNNFAAFDAFAGNDDDEDEDDEDVDEPPVKEDGEQPKSQNPVQQEEEVQPNQPDSDQKPDNGESQAAAPKKKTNKKKKKKKQGNGKQEVDDEEEKIDLEEFKGQDEEVKFDGDEDNSCLALNLYAFNYNKELGKYFKNAKLTEDIEREHLQGLNKQQRGHMKMMKNRNARNFRNFNLVHNNVSFMHNPERFSCEFVKVNE